MRTRRFLTVSALALLGLAGCGGTATSSATSSATPTATRSPNGEAARTGPEVAADAARELEAAGAVTVTGTVTDGGRDTDVDLHLEADALTGTVLTDGHAVEVIGTGGTLYAKTDAGYWISAGLPQALAERVADRWVIVPPALAAPLTPVSLLGLAGDLRDPPGSVRIQDAVSLDTVHAAGLAKRSGDPVVVLTESDGTTIDVAATGHPYPLLWTTPGPDRRPLTLGAFGERQPLATPIDAVDLRAALGG